MTSLLQNFHQEKNIYLLRHAESEYNRLNIIAGRIETPLTKKGKKQAKKTANWFKDKDIQYILHSPLSRAKDTAYAVYKNIHASVPVQEYDDLIEISAGIFEALSKEEVRTQYPELIPYFLQQSWEAVEKAEKISELIARCKKVWQKISSILQDTSIHNILLVAHGGFIQWLFKTAYGFNGQHIESWAPITKILNCGIFHLKINPAIDKNNTILGAHASWEEVNTIAY